MVGKKSLTSRFSSYFVDWIHTFKGQLTIVALVGLCLIPLLVQDAYNLGIFVWFMILTIFAASWDFLAGFVGQVSFGHAIFLGIGGYVTSYLVRYGIFYFDWNLGAWVHTDPFPWWISLFSGAILAVVMGLIIGIPALRLKGPYLALGTLAMSLILYQVFLMGTLADWWEATFGTKLFGSNGITLIRNPISSNPIVEYFIVLLILCVSLIVLIHITKSNTGTLFKAIRDDETGTRASGINVTKYKIIAFMISGFFAGIAGGLFAMHFRGVNPGVYQPLYSFYAIIVAALGGIATISGSALGAFIFVFVAELINTITSIFSSVAPNLVYFSLLTFSVILICFIRFFEHGIMNWLLEHLKDLWDFLLGR